jgi:hypothetical protein
MPIGKNIYSQMSKKAGERKKRIDKVVNARMNSGSGPMEPPTVEQYKKNIVARTKSNSLHITELAGVGRRISPKEGMPAVNGKSNEEVVKKAVRKIRPKTKEVDPAAGAIQPTDTKKNKKSISRKKQDRLCGNCKRPGHTKRSCPSAS